MTSTKSFLASDCDAEFLNVSKRLIESVFSVVFNFNKLLLVALLVLCVQCYKICVLNWIQLHLEIFQINTKTCLVAVISIVTVIEVTLFSREYYLSWTEWRG
jgi:hypothetical protein